MLRRSVLRTLVPFVVQRPLGAAETRRPLPLVTAPGTAATRSERVPRRAARLEERLRRFDPEAGPPAGRRRPPAAQRTPDTAHGMIAIDIGVVEQALIGLAIVFQEQHPCHTPSTPVEQASEPLARRKCPLHACSCPSRDTLQPSRAVRVRKNVALEGIRVCRCQRTNNCTRGNANVPAPSSTTFTWHV